MPSSPAPQSQLLPYPLVGRGFGPGQERDALQQPQSLRLAVAPLPQRLRLRQRFGAWQQPSCSTHASTTAISLWSCVPDVVAHANQLHCELITHRYLFAASFPRKMQNAANASTSGSSPILSLAATAWCQRSQRSGAQVKLEQGESPRHATIRLLAVRLSDERQTRYLARCAALLLPFLDAKKLSENQPEWRAVSKVKILKDSFELGNHNA